MNDLAKMYFAEDFGKVALMEDTIKQAEYNLKWIGAELMMTNDNLLTQLSNSE